AEAGPHVLPVGQQPRCVPFRSVLEWLTVGSHFSPARRPTSSADEFVADAVDSQNEARFLGIRFDLLSQTNNVRIHGARLGVALWPTHRVKRAVRTQRHPGITQKFLQQRNPLGRNLTRSPAARDLVLAQVDSHPANREMLLSPGKGARPPQNRLDASEQ